MTPFKKTTVKTYTPVWVRTDFHIYNDDFIRIRSSFKDKLSKCFKCNTPFKIGDTVNLASFKEVGNKVICNNCIKE